MNRQEAERFLPVSLLGLGLVASCAAPPFCCKQQVSAILPCQNLAFRSSFLFTCKRCFYVSICDKFWSFWILFRVFCFRFCIISKTFIPLRRFVKLLKSCYPLSSGKCVRRCFGRRPIYKRCRARKQRDRRSEGVSKHRWKQRRIIRNLFK